MTFYVEDETGASFSFPAEELAKQVAEAVLMQENGPMDAELNLLITASGVLIRTGCRTGIPCDRAYSLTGGN